MPLLKRRVFTLLQWVRLLAIASEIPLAGLGGAAGVMPVNRAEGGHRPMTPQAGGPTSSEHGTSGHLKRVARLY